MPFRMTVNVDAERLLAEFEIHRLTDEPLVDVFGLGEDCCIIRDLLDPVAALASEVDGRGERLRNSVGGAARHLVR